MRLEVFSSPLNDCVIVVVLVTQSCQLCHLTDSPPGSSVHAAREARRRNSHSCSESQEEVQKVHESLTQSTAQRQYRSQYEEMYLASPAGSNILDYLQQEEEKISPCLETAQPIRDCHNSANEN